MIDQIGKIVQTARERESLSLDDLAGRSGVPLETLADLEHGRIGIAATQLDDVARALSLDAGALLGGREVARRTPSVFLRHAPIQDFDERDGAVMDEVLEQGRTLAQLCALIGRPPAALQARSFSWKGPAADRAEAPAHEGYHLAGAVRRWLGNAEEPLTDARQLLEERFGVAVVVRTMATSRVTAASVRADDCAGAVISARELQRINNPLVTRVHLTHELCHLLFDPSPGGVQVVVDISADRRALAAEQRARAFAAEMLLPLPGLVRLLGDPRGVSETGTAVELVTKARSRFGTPHEITANHLCNRGFIDLGLRDWLEATTTPFAGVPPVTKLPVDGAPSLLVSDFVERANTDGTITDGEARAMLGIDRLAPLPWEDAAL